MLPLFYIYVVNTSKTYILYKMISHPLVLSVACIQKINRRKKWKFGNSNGLEDIHSISLTPTAEHALAPANLSGYLLSKPVTEFVS